MLKRLLQALTSNPAEVYGPPAPVRPKNPYQKGWPLARAWDRGFYERLRGRWPIGSSHVEEGRDAAEEYLRSGLALYDMRNGRLKLGF